MIATFCTCSSSNEAELIAKKLVSTRTAACVNIINGIRSIYLWEDELRQDEECLLIIKSSEQARSAIEQHILALHSYDLPEIISFSVDGGLEQYIDWVKSQSC